jgi:hypothetical protein
MNNKELKSKLQQITGTKQRTCVICGSNTVEANEYCHRCATTLGLLRSIAKNLERFTHEEQLSLWPD